MKTSRIVIALVVALILLALLFLLTPGVGAQGPTKTPPPVAKAVEPMPTSFVAPSLPTPAASATPVRREAMWPDGDWVALLSGVAIVIVLVISLFRRR